MGFFDSPSELKKFLEDRGLSLKKRFGQNFLIDPRVREKVLRALDPRPGEKVWEIGPGLGAMTDPLLACGVRLRCFEIDYGFIRVLEERYGGEERITVVPGDVLKTWKLYRHESPERVFGNLPYVAGAALIADFLEHQFVPGCWVFMVQKEVAERMIAPPGSDAYSSFSVLCQSFCNATALFDVRPEAFYPRPKVRSTLIRMLPRERPLGIEGEEVGLFTRLIRAGFSQRRKQLGNAVAPLLSSWGLSAESVWRASGIDPSRRGETLGPEEFLRLCRTIRNHLPPR